MPTLINSECIKCVFYPFIGICNPDALNYGSVTHADCKSDGTGGIIECQQKQHSFPDCVNQNSTAMRQQSTVSVNKEKKCLVKSGKVIFFIAETKGSMDSMQLKGVKKAKIDCTKRLFNEMSTSKVRYHEVASYQKLLDVMSSLL